MSATRPLLAIFNASDDAMDWLTEQVQSDAYDVRRAYVREFRKGTRDLAAFLRDHDPCCIEWDVSVPYQMNWTFLESVIATSQLDGRGLVITSGNPSCLDTIAGIATGAIEVSDGNQAALVAAVTRCLKKHSAML